MSTIVANQQRAFAARASDDARRLADSLRNLSPAEQAAVIASVTAAAHTPIDLLMLTETQADGLEAAAILDGTLHRTPGERWAWDIGSGCTFRIQILPKEHLG